MLHPYYSRFLSVLLHVFLREGNKTEMLPFLLSDSCCLPSQQMIFLHKFWLQHFFSPSKFLNYACFEFNSIISQQNPAWILSLYLSQDFIYLFIFREGKGGRKRETSMCGCLSSDPYREPVLQPRHVPWLGTELVTLWFTGQHSIHWATPARALSLSFSLFYLPLS